MDANVSIQEIFPTPLWIVDFDAAESAWLNIDLLKSIHALTDPKPALKVGESWQTDPDLHERAEFAQLVGLIQEASNNVLDFLEIDYEAFTITSCWANINPTGGKNSAHTHPNNYLSGVYYVAVPPGSGEIKLKDPRAQAAAILPPVKSRNQFNSSNLTVPVNAGRLILFPAWLSHEVMTNQSDEERVSISFNVMFRNYTETMSPTLWRKGSAPLHDS